MRELWLEEMAMKNAIENGYQDAQKILKTMLRKIHNKAMNEELNRIKNGEQSGLDFIEIPKGEWFNSEKNNELYRYNKGVFEAYLSDDESKEEFKNIMLSK